MQNQSIIDLLENEESTLNSSMERDISDAEFEEVMQAQEQLLRLLGNYQFTSQSIKKTYKIVQETLIDVYQNPSDYATSHTTAETIYTNFLYEMLEIIEINNNSLTIQNRNETKLTLKWYNIAMLLRSKTLSEVETTYLAALSTRDVNETLRFMSTQQYYTVIRQTEIQLHNDETARRRRYQRHIYFRNLNARRRGTARRHIATS